MNLQAWLVNAMVTWILWGLWFFLRKVGSRTIGWQNILLLSNISWFLLLPIFLVLYRKYFKFDLHHIDCLFALLSGFVDSAGVLFFYFALTKDETSRVIGIT